jgi:hypothetical protein
MKLAQKIAIRKSYAARTAKPAVVETVAVAPVKRVPSEAQREAGRKFFAAANAANAQRRAEKAAALAAETATPETLAA